MRPLNIPVILPTGRLTSSVSGRSQRYLFNANPDPNYNANPTNPTNRILVSTVVNKAAIFASTNNTTSTRQQLPFLSRDCSIISYIGRPDNDNHYADDRPNNYYQLKNSTWWTTEATLL